MFDKEYFEVDVALEAVLDTAMEAASKHVLDPKTRDSLPDKAFGIVYKNEAGETQRKYPLVVKSDKKKTGELVSKAIQFFHYCRPDWKPQLAKKIMLVIKQEGLKVTLSSRSQILKYVDKKDIPKTVTITAPAKKEKE